MRRAASYLQMHFKSDYSRRRHRAHREDDEKRQVRVRFSEGMIAHHQRESGRGKDDKSRMMLSKWVDERKYPTFPP
jgi:uncharacterized protein (DUF305 family)